MVNLKKFENRNVHWEFHERGDYLHLCINYPEQYNPNSGLNPNEHVMVNDEFNFFFDKSDCCCCGKFVNSGYKSQPNYPEPEV